MPMRTLWLVSFIGEEDREDRKKGGRENFSAYGEDKGAVYNKN